MHYLHCNDTTCQGGDDADSAIPNTEPATILHMLLDSSGRPVLLLNHSSTLKIFRCGDTACSAGNTESTLASLTFSLGPKYSFALDSTGNPVVAYISSSGELHVMLCDDPACAGGDDADVVLGSASTSSSTGIVLDANDHPVIVFRSGPPGGERLTFLRCNDPACEGGDDVPQVLPPPTPAVTQAGFFPAVVLDGSGRPVIAYWASNGFYIMHCNDADCAGNDESNVLAPGGGTLGANLMALDSLGRPVAISDGSGGFFVATCADATCSTGITRPRARVTPLSTIPAFDSADRPIIVVPSYPEPGLWVIHCANETCATDTDGDGCNDLSEISTGPAEFQVQRWGAERDPKNPWDFFDPSSDRRVRINDILAVVAQFGVDEGQPGYTTATDRTHIGPEAWNLGPPDGRQRIEDVLNAVAQFGHDCV